MKQRPYISVVIPSYNRAQLSIIAVESVLMQTFSDYEVIFVDDGSADGTGSKLSEFLQKRGAGTDTVRYIYQTNQGQSVARNRGIAEARGVWIAFLDSDDTWLPEKLERQLQATEKYGSQCGACFTNAHLLNNAGRELTAFQAAGFEYEHEVGFADDVSHRLARAFGGPWVQTSIARADLVRQIGGFDPDLHFAEDHDFLFRLSLVTKECYVNVPLATIDRANPADESPRLWEKLEFRLAAQERMFEKWLRLSPRLPGDIAKTVVGNLRSVHSSWANWCLENGRYAEARQHVWRAIKHELTPALAVKCLLTAAVPGVAKKIAPRSRSYFELT
jgi:glycosyltransferase involved in cell wall biosynthesis